MFMLKQNKTAPVGIEIGAAVYKSMRAAHTESSHSSLLTPNIFHVPH